jgi:hypothetical protein
MRPNADPKAAEAPEPVVPEQRARLRDTMRGRDALGGFTLTGFVVAEAVCTGVLVTAVVVMIL